MVKAATKRQSTTYRCADCGWQTFKWVGRCGECQAWGTIEESGAAPIARVAAGPVTAPALQISHVVAAASTSHPTSIAELDRVLGGGIVPGAVLLLAGEPGVGKSTLLLEVAACSAREGTTVLYVSGEESAAQVRLRAERTNALEERLYLAAETDLSSVLGHIEAVNPGLLVVDSVQTIASSDLDGGAGGVTQVRGVAAALVRVAKERHLPTLLVGHVTKDGSIAGPRALEHIVDVVLHFEGDRNSRLRLLRAIKNRFGPVDEIGCFDLGDEGIVEVADPTGLFVSRHKKAVSGTCVTVTLEGRRPLLAEVQSLLTPALGQTPRRGVSGLDSARVAMLQAVLTTRARLASGPMDLYAATVGGAVIREPAADLAVVISMASSMLGRDVPGGLVAIGEVGLAGELRRVPSLRQRLSEAARLGFTHAVVPFDHGPAPAAVPNVDGLSVIECEDVYGALTLLGLVGDSASQVPMTIRRVK